MFYSLRSCLMEKKSIHSFLSVRAEDFVAFSRMCVKTAKVVLKHVLTETAARISG